MNNKKDIILEYLEILTKLENFDKNMKFRKKKI